MEVPSTTFSLPRFNAATGASETDSIDASYNARHGAP
ncbi:hypothetical protein VTO73DRAFT_15568 [Trametes versicolor]